MTRPPKPERQRRRLAFLLDPDAIEKMTDEDFDELAKALNAKMAEERKKLGLPPLSREILTKGGK